MYVRTSRYTPTYLQISTDTHVDIHTYVHTHIQQEYECINVYATIHIQKGSLEPLHLMSVFVRSA